MSNVVYTPVQEDPDKQDAGVAFVLNEQTGQRRPLSSSPATPKPKRSRKKAEPAPVVVEAPVEEPVVEPVVEPEAEQPEE